MMDCYHGDVEAGLQLLGDYLAENQLVLDRLKTAEGKYFKNILLIPRNMASILKIYRSLLMFHYLNGFKLL